MKSENTGQRGSSDEYSISIGTFKPVSLAWHATATSQGRQIGVRLEFNGAADRLGQRVVGKRIESTFPFFESF